MYQPRGILPAVITPMHADGGIHEEALRAQIRRHQQSGVHGLFCLGTNGEFYALEEDEKIRVMEIVADENGHGLPLCAGVGCVTTAQTVRLAQRAQAIGVDAISVITPYFGQVGDAAMIEHCRTIARSVEVPVILYSIPMRTGNQITPAVLKALAGEPNIIAMKDSSGNFDLMLQYLEITDGAFPMLSGNDSLILSGLQAGAVGAIAATANLFPGKVSQIYELYQAGKIREAAQIQAGLRPIRSCFRLGNPNTVIKRAMELLGHPVGPVRAPFEGDYAAWDPVIEEVLARHYQGWS